MTRAMVPTRSHGIDVFERVLTKGVVLESDEGAAEASKEAGGAAAWLRVSLAGVDVVKVETGLAWQWLSAVEEKEKE
jgi:hypothetical protein